MSVDLVDAVGLTVKLVVEVGKLLLLDIDNIDFVDVGIANDVVAVKKFIGFKDVEKFTVGDLLTVTPLADTVSVEDVVSRLTVLETSEEIGRVDDIEFDELAV